MSHQPKLRRKIAKLAPMIRDQAHLDEILMSIPNRLVRREVFHLYKPFIVSFEPKFGGEVATYHRRD